eukprot:UN01154
MACQSQQMSSIRIIVSHQAAHQLVLDLSIRNVLFSFCQLVYHQSRMEILPFFDGIICMVNNCLGGLGLIRNHQASAEGHFGIKNTVGHRARFSSR